MKEPTILLMSGAPENEQKEPRRGEEAPKVRFANERAELLQISIKKDKRDMLA